MTPSIDSLASTISHALPSLASNGHAAPTKLPHKEPTASLQRFKGAAVESSNLDVVRDLASGATKADTLELTGYDLSPADVVSVARKHRRVAIKQDDAISLRIDQSVEFLRGQLGLSVYGVTTVRPHFSSRRRRCSGPSQADSPPPSCANRASAAAPTRAPRTRRRSRRPSSSTSSRASSRPT